ncbi:MAG: lamin tail domain-containing protein, partial [Candidatus Nanohaloarchaea archaeon]
MAAIPQAAIAASVIVGLLAVPAASKGVEMTGAATKELPDVSTAESVPKTVSRMVSSDRFHAVIETAFNRFSTSISSGSANATLESPAAELKVTRTPDSIEWVLTTPDGTLRVVKSSEKVVREVSTPNGELRVVEDEGSRKVSFTGSDRRELEKKMQQLMDLLEQKRKELQERRSRLRQRAMPDIRVVINDSLASSQESSATPEQVVLVNRELQPVSLEGWKIRDASSVYRFGDVVLEPGEKLHVYSANNSVVDGEPPAVYDTAIGWNGDSDTATL